MNLLTRIVKVFKDHSKRKCLLEKESKIVRTQAAHYLKPNISVVDDYGRVHRLGNEEFTEFAMTGKIPKTHESKFVAEESAIVRASREIATHDFLSSEEETPEEKVRRHMDNGEEE